MYANGNGQEQTTPHAGAIVREGFDNHELELSAETASTAIAAQAQAAVQARYVMALRKPRDFMQVRQKLLAECSRPAFADCAIYSKPVGNKPIEGLSIRFVEAAIRCMGNILVESSVIFEDSEKRIVRVAVTDLESNLTYPTEILVQKTVERSRLKDGQTPLRQRQNSRGQVTYLVEATEDDLLNKQNALVSKAIRTNALRLIPGDLQDEAEAKIRETQHNRDAKDPDAARKNLVDGFARLGISAAQLAEYLGHGADTMTPDEMVELRALGLALKDKETTWREVMEARGKEAAEAAKPSANDALKAKLRGEKSAAPAAAPATTSTAEPATKGEIRASPEPAAERRVVANEAPSEAEELRGRLETCQSHDDVAAVRQAFESSKARIADKDAKAIDWQLQKLERRFPAGR